ncbi:tyrosine-protein phosphatase siw14 [Coniosporium apollinis]|uniref:Tyrosine-protein phosphatase siw14 n=1 Tax=Coniosporium apollinis TaxID=61459 RepID=A0ABQ9NIR4_9PEZI|nr:tyrosine-protein phosphatase siw14 [Coniosporium apollinis]
MALNTTGTAWQFSRSFIKYVQDQLLQRTAPNLSITIVTMAETVPNDGEVVGAGNEEAAVIAAPTSPRKYIAGPGPDRLQSLVPPPNFGAVVAGKIYRSSFPHPENLDFLGTLKLKTILTLVNTPYPEANVEFVKQRDIQHVTILLPANKEVIRVSQCDMTRVLNVVLDTSNHPLLIHCNKGKHRTGCVVGAFRKTLGESFENIFAEYHVYAGAKARKLDEAFIEQFDTRTVLWLARANGFVEGNGSESPMLGPVVKRQRTAA